MPAKYGKQLGSKRGKSQKTEVRSPETEDRRSAVLNREAPESQPNVSNPDGTVP